MNRPRSRHGTTKAFLVNMPRGIWFKPSNGICRNTIFSLANRYGVRSQFICRYSPAGMFVLRLPPIPK